MDKKYSKTNSEFVKLRLDNNYISNIDTKNFAVKAPIIKELMFDSNIKTLEDFELYLRLKRIAKIRFLPSAEVSHNHPSSFQGVVKTIFQRGYYAKKIFDKHKKKSKLKDKPIELMLESISVKNFLTFPFWMVFQFFKKPLQETYFKLVTELSWRAGVVWATVKQ